MTQRSTLLTTSRAFTAALLAVVLGSSLACATPVVAAAPPPGLRPPMGWSSWSSLRGSIDAAAIKEQALAMHNNLQKHGYEYVNMDAGWRDGIDQYGRFAVDKKKFPGGIAPVAEYVHSLGLKFGVHLIPGIPAEALEADSEIKGTNYHISDIADTESPGNTLDDGSAAIDYSKPGAAAYVQSQVDLLASWGVDYVKMDFVGPGGGKIASDNQEDVKHWHEAIEKNGRPIYLGLSNSLSFDHVSTWQRYANAWRINGDVECYKKCPGQVTDFNLRIALRFKDVPKWVPYAGPGHWNDLDAVVVGSGTASGLNKDERQTTITLWAIESAPLLLGADLTKLDPYDLGLLTNPEVIAVDQAGHPALPLSQDTNQQVWFANNGDGSYTVALFNLAESPATVTATWSKLGISGPVSARNLWTRTDLGRQGGSYSVRLAPHASQLLRVTTS